jgi:hypothetical protein
MGKLFATIPEIVSASTSTVSSTAEPCSYVDDNQLRDYCFDRDFWIHLSDLAAILTPLTQKLHLLEGDTYVPKVSSLLVNWLGA